MVFSALNSSVPIIKGNLTFTLLSMVILLLTTETASSSISSTFLFFFFIWFKHFRDKSIAIFFSSSFVIWIPLWPSFIISSFASDSLSSLSKVFSTNLSLDNVFNWLIAFKCSTSIDSMQLSKLSIFLQNCWNSSL